ncbi:MAG: lipopolysaccharide heptosyltransferase II [Acidobacteriia bacterium]|nr:lipopolysaccharide heptosyltransferase II [Terriglobia bacterium]
MLLLLAMTPQFSKVLIRGVSWIGDSVLSVPALRELRRLFPKAHLTLMVKPWVSDLFVHNDFLDELLIERTTDLGQLQSLTRQAGELQKRHFDTAILFQNSFAAAALAFLARVPSRLGLATDGRHMLLTHPLPVSEVMHKQHQVFYYLHIVARIADRFLDSPGVDFTRLRYQLTVSPAQQQGARNLLKQYGVDFNNKLIVLNPGATNSMAKRWLPERFALLADRLMERKDCTVVLIGAASDGESADAVAARMSHSPIRLTGKTSLAESMGILSLCHLLITNDTGPAHVAAALDRPTLTICGPTDPWATSPISSQSHIIWNQVSCAPCLLRDCPLDHRCMKAVSVDKVYEKAAELLKE